METPLNHHTGNIPKSLHGEAPLNCHCRINPTQLCTTHLLFFFLNSYHVDSDGLPHYEDETHSQLKKLNQLHGLALKKLSEELDEARRMVIIPNLLCQLILLAYIQVKTLTLSTANSVDIHPKENINTETTESLDVSNFWIYVHNIYKCMQNSLHQA